MINLTDVKSSIFTPGSIIAEVYKNSHFLFKTMITPFKSEMVNANNVILFVDDNFNITSGQIGTYNRSTGINTITF